MFLPAVFILYRAIPSLKFKNLLLAAASIVFYAFGQLKYVPLFLASVLINYASGLLLQRAISRRKLILAVSVILNIGILCFYKYTDFIIRNLNDGLALSLSLTGLELQIGISFFTFQGLSYTIDVYRDRKTGTKDFLRLLLYISFFPQLIAGPIVKYHDIADQITERRCTPEQTTCGISRFVRGLSKKILIANAVGYIADQVFDKCLPGGITDWPLMWLGGICYTLQIYYDFSGYSDMAIGMGHMFGFRFRENFDYPYGSSSIKEFWRKWHISLSSWFKEYLYIPLGGNRKGKWRTALNKLIVFFLTGLWHGANFTFIVLGMIHGLCQMLETYQIIPTKKKWFKPIGHIYTMLVVIVAFVIFRADTLTQGLGMIAHMFNGAAGDAAVNAKIFSCVTNLFIISFIFAVFCSTPVFKVIKEKIDKTKMASLCSYVAYSGSLVLFLLSILSLVSSGYNPFIYFRF